MVKLRFILIIFIFLLLIGCMKDQDIDNTGEDIIDMDNIDLILDDGQEEVTLRVLYNASPHLFMQQYGYDIEEMFDYINIEVVMESFGSGTRYFEKIIQEKEIDIILPGVHYHSWATEEWLLPLDPYMDDPMFQAENILPSVLESLRSIHDGRVYGLSPTFSGMALLYNVDIFDQYEVPYPTNYMSWEDVFRLAQQFPAKEVVGFYSRDLVSLAMQMANTYDVAIVDDAGEKVLIADNESWREIVEHIVAGERAGAISFGEYLAIGNPNFFDGEAAMSLVHSSWIELQNDMDVDFAWDSVTEPIHHDRPEQTSSIGPDDIMSISVYSAHPETAWEVISYINGEEYLPKLAERHQFKMLSRTSYLERYNDERSKAFYALSPSGINNLARYSNPSFNWHVNFDNILNEVLSDILDESITVEQGIQELQREGQELLDERNRMIYVGEE